MGVLDKDLVPQMGHASMSIVFCKKDTISAVRDYSRNKPVLPFTHVLPSNCDICVLGYHLPSSLEDKC